MCELNLKTFLAADVVWSSRLFMLQTLSHHRVHNLARVNLSIEQLITMPRKMH